jgi:hypothetical protein
VVLLAGIITWPMIRGNAANTNYDFITTCCIVILFIEACATPVSAMRHEYILWTCFLFTVRIINFPLLLLAAFMLWKYLQHRDLKKFTGGILMGVFLIIPFIARNIILSGYAFFPVYQVDIFSADWKADREMMVNIVEYIRYFNRVNTMFMPLEETSRMAFPGWIPAWLHYLFAYDKLLLLVSLLCFIASLFGLKRLRRQLNPHAGIFVAVLIFQLIVWFFIAPDVRFVYGPLLCGMVLAGLSLPSMPVKQAVRIAWSFAIVLLIGCLVYSGRKIITATSSANFLFPEPLPVPPVHTVMLDGIPLNIPEKIENNWNARCYGTALPCLYSIHPGLHARGKNITDGFYIDHHVNDTLPKGVWY